MVNHLFDAFRKSAEQNAAHFMLDANGRSWSFKDVFDGSAKLAGAMRRLGVEAGDRVAVQVEKSAEALVHYLACLRCGAIYLPLNTGYTQAEISYFVGDAEPKLLVVSPDRRSIFEDLVVDQGLMVETLGVQANGSLMELARQEEPTFADEERISDDIAAILYTSGTTGRSKGAMLTHGNLLSNARALVDYWQVTSQDHLIHALPIYHAHGLFVATHVMLLAGGSMTLLPKFDAEEVLSFIDKGTILMGVPTFYTRLLQSAKLDRGAVSRMRLFISGSAPLLADTHEEFQRRTGHAILERYGMTETGMNTSNPYDGERLAGTVGFPLPGISIRVRDSVNNESVVVGDTGMIEIKGPNVFKGYWKMPDKTAAEFTDDGYFISGDLGKFDERGYLQIVGRQKDLIISGGFNIYPKEIEIEIDGLDGVIESAVIGVTHPDFGEGVVAVVVRSKGSPLNEAGVLAHLNGCLAKYKLPKRVMFVEDLPRNAMGKVQKQMLRETNKELFASM